MFDRDARSSAVLAPTVFPWLIEYPLSVLIARLLMPRRDQ